MTLLAKTHKTIEEVDPELWNSLVGGRSCTFSHEFWSLIERSGLNDFDYRHVLFYDDAGRAVAATTFYSITTDIAIFAPEGLRNLLARVRRLFPNFLKLRMLECGTPIILNSPPFFHLPDVSKETVIEAVTGLLRDTARHEGQLLIVIRDFEPNAFDMQPLLAKQGYHWVDGLPNNYLQIRWSSPEAYLASLKSYYRSKLLKHLRINASNGVRHELHTDFADLAETLCQQWRVVHEQADEFQREVLTPVFYREFSGSMGEHSKVLLFYRANDLVGHALLLMDGDLLRWLYFGRKDAGNDSLYLYVGYTVIETAIRLGAKHLEMGLTTYSIKSDLGAQITPIKMAIRSSWGPINPFVGFFYPLLNDTPVFENKNVFKASA